jgi:hypothetical protein
MACNVRAITLLATGGARAKTAIATGVASLALSFSAFRLLRK